MKNNSRKLEIKKNLKYITTLVIRLCDTQDVKELIRGILALTRVHVPRALRGRQG
jgi:hypothetical protein